ncbi:pentapeptide repeat-containing protein [Pseudooceanicola algae]|nr:pentapeptide repeat-containing protein [Pseudooceanicola algae]
MEIQSLPLVRTARPLVERETLESTEPNLEVRIGAILSLERIAQDSARDHIQIMKILCAYVRENIGGRQIAMPAEDASPEKWREWGGSASTPLRLDLDMALKVIEDRDPTRKAHEAIATPPYVLGLERLEATKLDLFGRNLEKANLSGARMQGAHLVDATLLGAKLGGAQLQGADLGGAQLQGANLEDAKLQAADLWGAQLDIKTSLARADFRGAAVKNVDLSNVPQITGHLTSLFGDASVSLPSGARPGQEGWPEKWPTFELDPGEFRNEWQKWQADPEAYTPPIENLRP